MTRDKSRDKESGKFIPKPDSLPAMPYSVKLSEEMREWVKEHGSGELIRELITREMVRVAALEEFAFAASGKVTSGSITRPSACAYCGSTSLLSCGRATFKPSLNKYSQYLKCNSCGKNNVAYSK